MTKELRRIIGFIIYYQEKVVSRKCDVCVLVAEQKTSDVCKYCMSTRYASRDGDVRLSVEDGAAETTIEHPNWKEVKGLLQADWDEKEKDLLWEDTMTSEMVAFLDELEIKNANTAP